MSKEKEQSQGTLTKQRRTEFVMTPHHLFCNNRHTAEAKSLWVVLESKPEGWKFYWSEILKHFKEGRDQIKNAMKELEKAGYVQRKRAKKGNIYCGMDIQVFYDPLLPFDPFDQENKGSPRVTEFQSPGIQSPETQLTESRSSENQTVYKEISKQYSSKKELINKNPKTNFTIPDNEELKSFFENFCSDWEEFRDYYSSNGWKISGKTPMVDWQAAARNWEKKYKKYNPNAKSRKINEEETKTENPQIQSLRAKLSKELPAHRNIWNVNKIEDLGGKFTLFCKPETKVELLRKYWQKLEKFNIELVIFD